MFDRFLCAVSVAVGFSILAMPALSATMTFSDVGVDYTSNTYSEDGIFASGNGDLGLYNPRALHFDDGGTSAPSKVSFSMASNFDALSFLLDPVKFNFYVIFEDKSFIEPTYLNVLVQGFRDGALVSNLMFDMGSSPDPYLVNLGGAFNNLSSLVIGILYPNLEYYRSLPGAKYTGFCDPCSHFNVDNVTLAPVPLPAGLPLVASGLAMLAFIARRRKFI